MAESKFKIGDKVRLNEKGRKELVEPDAREGLIREIKSSMNFSCSDGSISEYYYLSGGVNYGTWECYLELDE